MNSIPVWNWLFTAPENKDQNNNTQDTTTQEYRNEFHQVYHEFVNDIIFFRDKYPLVTLVSMFFLCVFGLLNIFSFSITNIITGAFLMTLSASLAMSIQKKGWPFWGEITNSIWKLFKSAEQVKKQSDPPKA